MITKSLKIRKKIKTAKIIGYSEGELKAAKDFNKNLTYIKKEHERQINQLISTHKREMKILEKEYNIKATRLDKKMEQVDKQTQMWEDKLGQVREASSQSHELLARVKQALYQDRKKYANILDDEQTLKNLQAGVNGMLQKAASSRQNATLL